MAMGRRKREEQGSLWIATVDLPQSDGHPFYELVNRILDEEGFDAFVEDRCKCLYADKMGRPSLPPAIYFRMLMIGYFEGIDSERGIAWRVRDSLSLRRFLGYSLTDQTTDHSTISRTRRRTSVETHQEVFNWMLAVLAKRNLLSGKTLGIDATTLEANAALRSIVRRDTQEGYQEFLTRLAEESGIETPTRQDLAKLDKTRKNKASNKDWQNPFDPDAKITKMKDGRTHLAHKAEHAVDMETGALVAVTLQPADRGDTTSIETTIQQADANLVAVMKDEAACDQLSKQVLKEIVADKGYHSDKVLTTQKGREIRTYIAEPDRGRRTWQSEGMSDEEAAAKLEARDAVYGNRRRTGGERGKELMGDRGELVERSFAHCYDTGGMRRTHLQKHNNILKRLLIHAAGFNLSLVLRVILGLGTARGLQGLSAAALRAFLDQIAALWAALQRLWIEIRAIQHLALIFALLERPRAQAAA
jgi:transposase